MQKRHRDHRQYFDELSRSTEKYLLPFLEEHFPISPGMRVLEVGCGAGGNLLPFLHKGCRVGGIDLSAGKIDAARERLGNRPDAELKAGNFFDLEPGTTRYDLIFIRDVIEHISDKDAFLKHVRKFLAPGGHVLVIFPAWQMPFGGHQQICRNGMLSRLPFFHLLPAFLYRGLLWLGKDSPATVEELLDIKRCGLTVERFRKKAAQHGFRLLKERLYFINPHYEIKFGLKPRLLAPVPGKIPGLRNFFTTSAWYLLAG